MDFKGNPLLYDRDIQKEVINGEGFLRMGRTWIKFLSYKRSRGEFIYTPPYSNKVEKIILKDFCRQLLPKFNGILLHSAGIVRDGEASIFLGSGGTGKTTVAGLAKSSLILSDDQVLLRKMDGEFYAFSTPFGRKTLGFIKAKPCALFFLKKSRNFSLSRLRPMEGLARAWYDHRVFWQRTSPLIRDRLFSLFYELFKSLPSYEMEFTKDFIDWEEIDRVSKGLLS